MKLEDLAEEYTETRPWLVIGPEELTAFAIQAARFYAGYGDIASVSATELPQSAAGAGLPLPAVPDPEPAMVPALPIRNLKLIKDSTDVSASEWAVISPLFALYVERENAIRLEASRGSGIDPYGRSVSEIAQEISVMENDVLPAKAFQYAVITV